MEEAPRWEERPVLSLTDDGTVFVTYSVTNNPVRWATSGLIIFVLAGSLLPACGGGHDAAAGSAHHEAGTSHEGGAAFPDGASPRGSCDLDGDGYEGPQCGGPDCNDGDPTIHPGATDVVCDGIDQDCNGSDNCSPSAVWELCKVVGFHYCLELCQAKSPSFCPTDADGDGSYTWQGCTTGTNSDCDCNDGDSTIHPGATEIQCDGIDQNCDGRDYCPRPDADGDGYQACGTCPPGKVCGACDCNDQDPTIHPFAKDIPCDGIDQDCDGHDCCDNDDDMDGYACKDDCDDHDPSVYPGACWTCGPSNNYCIVCKDVNCDGKIDASDFCNGMYTCGLP